MSKHGLNSRRPRSRPAIIVALLVAGLFGASGAPAQAQAQPQSHKLTAITAMPSKLSSLRRDAQGNVMTQRERDAELADDSSSTLGNSDLMGTPANKTVVESDQVLRETNTSGTPGSGGNTTTVSAYGLTADMSGIQGGAQAESPLTQRAVIDHQYPSQGGHFLDSTHMGVLDFKQQVAGNDALFTLASPNQSAENWSVATTGSQLAAGTTYQITQGAVALTNSEIAKSEALGTQATSTKIAPGDPDPSQLWSVVDSGHGDGTFSLVNRADGLCLARNGQKVTVDSCIDDPTRHWNQNYDQTTHQSTIFPVASGVNSSLGSDGGQGVADTLGANTTQTWTALALNEPSGSVPSWSVDRANGYTTGNVAAPYDMAVGDLDGIPTPDGAAGTLAYHDEAVVAWADADDDLQLRVIDYNANASHLLVTAPTQTALLGKKVGDPAATQGRLGDVLVGVGDFNGDGKNEIVTAYQDTNSDFTFAFWSYVANADGSRTLQPATCNGCQGAQPFTAANNISDETGYADLAVGDFDGDGRDEIALGFTTWSSATDTTDHNANLGVWTLNSDLSTRSVQITAMPTDEGTLPRTLNADPTRTQSGIRLVAGNFLSDPDHGFGPERSELAIAYDLYAVGGKVWDINISGYERPYKVTPVMNIYSVTTGNCNNTQTACTTQTAPTNTQDEPTPIFPSHPSQTAYEDLGTSLDAAPLSFTAGGFAGTAATDPPVEGLLASAWLEWDTPPSGDFATYYTQDSIVVPWVAKDTAHTKWTINDSQQKLGDEDSMRGDWILRRYTAYDRQGDSIVLGAPAILYIEQQDHETMVAAQPPSQVDWLNGGWSIPSASSAFYLQAGSSKTSTVTTATQQQNTWSQAVSEGTDVKASWSTDSALAPEEKGSVDVNQKFSQQWSGLSENATDTSSSWSTTQVAQTNQDDDFSYSADDTTLYRYPVIGGPGQFSAASGACQQGCRSYYDVAVPQGSVHFDHRPGQSIDAFQPSWENMNALSYPVLDPSLPNGPVPIPDLGDYSYPDTDGDTTTQDVVDAPLYDQANIIGGNSGQISLDFTKSQGSGSTLSSSRNWDVSVDVTAHANISVGDWANVFGFGASLDITASVGYDQSHATSGSTMGTNQTTTDTSFVLNHPTVDSGVSYEVGTAYYYAADGAAKVVHGVDLTSDPQGKGWWLANYGQTPDPSLNLPGRIELLYDSSDLTYDSPAWLTSPQRQKIRQFQVLQGSDDSSGLGTKGDPYTVNPAAGQPVQFEVPVHNYSLAAMKAPTTATWYAVPVDADDNDVTGPATTIGTSTVPALQAQGVANVQSPMWTAADNAPNNAMQQYRIFVRLDEAGTSPDMHPLSGPACPTTSLAPSLNNTTPALYDTMKPGNVSDPLGCGQDNQGYGLVTIDPASTATGVGATRLATAASPAGAQLNGGGLLDSDPSNERLTETSDVPTIPVNQKVTGLVFASSDLLTDDQPTVAIYDGPVSNDNLVAVEHMPGISPSGGGTTSFSWTPTTPGLHELHEVLLGTAATGQDDEQIMRVNVASPLPQYSVKAAASASRVPFGHAYSIAGTVTPVPDTGFDRTVQLQQKVGNDWTVIGSQQASSTGAFTFSLTQAKAGTYVYRVLKVATPGRYAAASAPITVAIGGSQVTIKASPTSVQLGKTVTFTGTVLPAQATAADRTVDLQLKSGASWTTVATGRTTATGAYTLTTKPAKAGTMTYRVTKPATKGVRAAASPTVSVRVNGRSRVTTRPRPTMIRPGQQPKISGKHTPTAPRSPHRR